MYCYPDDSLTDDETGFPVRFLSSCPHGGDTPFCVLTGKNEMKVDIQMDDNMCLIDIDLPDFSEDQIYLDLDDGFLTVTAEKYRDTQETDIYGRMIYREKLTDILQRGFFVDRTLTPDDIRARYAVGVLRLELPVPRETRYSGVKCMLLNN
ncbi:MAG: Hsp20 family protein [Clostridia bacterium]|nr:Hsp20 family protein [Clostridia bacterium]